MAEVVLPIEVKGDYKNVQIKPKFNKKSLKFEGGLQDGDTAKFVKLFDSGRAVNSVKFTNKDGSPSISYSCKAKDVNGNEISFWLTEAEHDQFVALGPKDTAFTVQSQKETVINPVNGAEIPRFRLKFIKN